MTTADSANNEISLRKYQGKQLVAYLRQNDYAHAGEQEAIDLVMRYFKASSQCSLLDVGCGLGGTAHYLKKQGWSEVTGFDIDQQAIEYARQYYPDIDFYQSDVVKADQVLPTQYFILTLFNVFYAFNDQDQALNNLYKITAPQGYLAIFDYADPCQNGRTPLYRQGDTNTTPFIPVKLDQIQTQLDSQGWQLLDKIDVTEHYIRWYTDLINRLYQHQPAILELFNQDAFDTALQTYQRLLKHLEANQLAGVIIYAQKQ